MKHLNKNMSKFLMVLVVVLTSVYTYAQNNKHVGDIKNNGQTPLKFSNNGQATIVDDKQHVDKLFFGDAPKEIVAEGTKQVDNKNSTLIEINAENLSHLSNFGTSKSASQVESLIIKVESPAGFDAKLQFNQLSLFPNLNSILVLCTYNACDDNDRNNSCVESKINAMIEKRVMDKVELYYLMSVDN